MALPAEETLVILVLWLVTVVLAGKETAVQVQEFVWLVDLAVKLLAGLERVLEESAVVSLYLQELAVAFAVLRLQ